MHQAAFNHCKEKIEQLLKQGFDINEKNALGNRPLDEAIFMLIMRQEYNINHSFLRWMSNQGAFTDKLTFYVQKQVQLPEIITADVSLLKPMENYYDLHWIIVRLVRRWRDERYRSLFDWKRLLPIWYERYYDYHQCEKDLTSFGNYWTKEHEWKYKQQKKTNNST